MPSQDCQHNDQEVSERAKPPREHDVQELHTGVGAPRTPTMNQNPNLTKSKPYKFDKERENPSRELKLGFSLKSGPVPVRFQLGTGPGPVWFQVELFSKPGVGFETILELDPACPGFWFLLVLKRGPGSRYADMKLPVPIAHPETQPPLVLTAVQIRSH